MATVYIESTIPSLYTGRPSPRLIEAARQQLTRVWWDHHRFEFDLVCSQTVIDECAIGDAEMAAARLELLRPLPLLDLTEDVVVIDCQCPALPADYSCEAAALPSILPAPGWRPL